MRITNTDLATQLDCHLFGFHPEFCQHYFSGFDVLCFVGEDALPPPSAFFGIMCPLVLSQTCTRIRMVPKVYQLLQ